MSGTNVPVAVLKNRGVPVLVHQLVVDEDGNPRRPLQRQFNGEEGREEAVFETRYVQFTNAVLVDLENPEVGWESQEAWETALREKPNSTITKTVAIALGLWIPGAITPSGFEVPDVRRAGVMMRDGETDECAAAIGAAYMMSQGIAAEHAGEALRVGIRGAKEVRPLIDTAIAKTLQQTESDLDEGLRKASDAAEPTPTSPAPPAGESPGTTGSTVGAEQDGPPTSSGD